MEWIQFIIFFIGVFGLFIWNRAESRTDMRHMDSKLEAQRGLIMEIHKESRDSIEKWRQDSKNNMEKWQQESKDFQQESKDFQQLWQKESKDFQQMWLAEVKDFHKRLCEIESRRN